MLTVIKSSGLRWLWLTMAVLLFDQISKQLAVNGLVLHEAVPLLPSLNLMLAYNSGAAFSFLSSASGWQRWFFVILALVVSTVLMFWLRRLNTAQGLQASALALILGGALGNVWDRLSYGYVIDFIDVYYGAWHWPVFNVADSAIAVGAMLLIIDTIRGPAHGTDAEAEIRAGENKHD
jgi:signal peptidase II